MTIVEEDDYDKSEVKELMLSTSDNPYNPFTQFREWYAFDIANGYNTCSYLARVCELSERNKRNTIRNRGEENDRGECGGIYERSESHNKRRA